MTLIQLNAMPNLMPNTARDAMRVLGFALLVTFSFSASAQSVPGGETKSAPRAAPAADDADATLSAVVQIKMKAISGSRSASTLGPQREGSGIVIDRDGHIVTIGYVVTEAESIEVTTNASKTVPACLVGYDHGTGLGLLKTTLPLEGVTPMTMGEAGAMTVKEPVMILPYGGKEAASLGYLMSKRKFTASWEYLLESALFVSPPTMRWAGAALVNREGKLVGIGSLLLRTVDEKQQVPANMFVPVDALKPILKDLIAKGRRAEPPRPWLGVSTEEWYNHLYVINVSRGSPAEKAGIKRGDILVSVGKEPVRSHEDFYRRLWSMGEAGVEVPLRILQNAELKEVKVRSIDRVELFQTAPVR